MDVRRRRAVAGVLAVACAAVDLALKAGLEGTVRHPRSAGVVVLSLAVAALLLALVPRFPSRTAAIAAGVGAGGAIGNALSAWAFSGGVPDPLLLSRDGIYVAFNLADVFALVSAFALISAAGVYVLRNPGALRDRL
jgi:lipoprotein signal peptidase